MNKNTYLLWILFSIFLFSGCEYELSEDFYNDIEIKAPNVSLSLSNFSEGEVFRASREIYYDYDSASRNALYEIRFFIDEEQIETSYKLSGSVFIDIRNLDEGNHKLKVEYFFKTGTGSLAEVSGVESYQVAEVFNFKVDKESISVEIDRVEHRDGSLYIYFKPYELINEVDRSILVTLLVYDNSNNISREIVLTKNDLIKGYYNDRDAFELKLKYQVKTENDYGGNIESEIKEINIVDTFNFKIEFLNLTDVKLEWGIFPLYNNIGKINFKYGTSYEEELNKEGGELIIENRFDIFGGKYSYDIDLFSRENFYHIKREKGQFYLGDEFSLPDGYDHINYIKFIPNINDQRIIYGLEISGEKDVLVHKINIETLKTENIEFITKTSKYFGDLSYDKSGDLILDLNSKSLVLDNNSLNIKKEYSFDVYNTELKNNSTIIRFRENVVVFDNTNESEEIIIYNSESKEKVFQHRKIQYFGISNDASVFVIDDDVFEIEDDFNVKKVIKFPDYSYINDFEYIESEHKIYYKFFNRKLNEFKINDKEDNIVRSIEEINVRSFNRSFGSNKMLVNELSYRSDTFIHLLDLNTQEIKSLKVANVRVSEMNLPQVYYFINNSLISTRGFILKNVF